MLVISGECSRISFQIKDSVFKAIKACNFDFTHPSILGDEGIGFYTPPTAPNISAATIVLVASPDFRTLHQIQGEILKFSEFQIRPVGIFAFLNLLRARERLPFYFKLMCGGDCCHIQGKDRPYVFTADATIKRDRVLWLDDAMKAHPPFTWIPCLVP